MESQNIKDSIEFILGGVTNEMKLLRKEVENLRHEIQNTRKTTFGLSRKVAALWTGATLVLNYLISNPSIIIKIFKP